MVHFLESKTVWYVYWTVITLNVKCSSFGQQLTVGTSSFRRSFRRFPHFRWNGEEFLNLFLIRLTTYCWLLLSLIIYSNKVAKLERKTDFRWARFSVLFFELALMGNWQKENWRTLTLKVLFRFLKNLKSVFLRHKPL